MSKEEKPGVAWPSPRTTGIQNSQSVRQGCVPNQKPPFYVTVGSTDSKAGDLETCCCFQARVPRVLVTLYLRDH